MSRLMLPLSVLLLVLPAAFSELRSADEIAWSQEQQERRDKPPIAGSKDFIQVSQSISLLLQVIMINPTAN